ncbi:MAG: substrate-binding domain-containing protein [Anaerolineae bacterium]|nr:substrate-binding domain-containing protein [Anaerolineae bacterium]
MTNTPRINRFLFVLYILLTVGVLVAALIWPAVRVVAYAPLRDLLFPAFYLPTSAGIEARITVAAPPTLEAWVREAAADFNRQNTLIEVGVISLRGAEAGRRLNASVTDLPDVWIAEAGFVRTSVGGVPYESGGPSVAQDGLAWVAVASSDVGGDLSWRSVADAARSDIRFRVAVPPVGSVEGMAACASAAAEYHQQANLTADLLNDAAFRGWLDELLAAAPNRSRHPRDQLGSRPPEVDAGLILGSDWQQLAKESFIYQPPAYNVVFDFPYLVRTNWYELSEDEANARRIAAERFSDFLLGGGPQGKLVNYGLERAGAEPSVQIVSFDDPAVRALQACWQ